MDLNSSFFAGKRMGKSHDVARDLDVNVNTVYAWVRGGVPIPHYNVLRLGVIFDLDQVAAWYDRATDGRTHMVVWPSSTQAPRPFPNMTPNIPAEAAKAWSNPPPPPDPGPLAALTFDEKVELSKKFAMPYVRIVAKEMTERGEPITLESLLTELRK